MASGNFRNLPNALARGQIDFSTNTFKALLVSSAPTETNLDSWTARSGVTNEVTGTGYTAGGFAVTAAVGSIDTTNNRVPVTFSVTNPVLTSATVTAVGMIVYKSTGVAANDTLVTYVEFASSATATNGNFSVTFDTPLYINA